MGIDGKVLDPVCRNPDDPHHVSDGLLRWHFRQSVLANVRGLGSLFLSMIFQWEVISWGKLWSSLMQKDLSWNFRGGCV